MHSEIQILSLFYFNVRSTTITYGNTYDDNGLSMQRLKFALLRPKVACMTMSKGYSMAISETVSKR